MRGQVVSAEAYEELLHAARDTPDVALEIQVISDYGRFLIAQHGDGAALDMFRKAYAYVTTQPTNPARTARILNGLGTIERRLDRLDEAMQHLTEAYQLAHALGAPDVLFPILNNLASFQLWAGEPEEALQMHREACRLAEQTGNLGFRVANIVNRMSVHSVLGNHEKVTELYDQFNQVAQGTAHADDFGPRAALEFSRTLLALGHTLEAREQAEAALERIPTWDKTQVSAALHLLLARVRQQQGDVTAALTYARQALEQAEQGNHHRERLEANETLGELYRAAGEHAQAVTHLHRALILTRERQDRAVQARTHAYRAVSRLQQLERDMRAAEARNQALVRDNEELQRAQNALRLRVTHDALTGLLQRDAFRQQVGRWLGALLPGQQGGMLFIDLDDFKSVNTLYGHQFGDRLLQQVASRLLSILPPFALIGRMGGDEFMAFVPPPTSSDDLEFTAQDIMKVLRAPFEPDGHTVEISASIGYALAPEHGLDAETLQRNADLAMQHAKRSARAGIRAFTPLMQETQDERLRLERDLQSAMRRGEFSLHFQARFDLPDRGLRGFEALLRWQHGVRGAVTPAKFIPMAERSGFILPLGRWVLHEACLQAMQWRFPERNLLMSVNVSPLQFEHPSFIQDVQNTLAVTGLPGRLLVLELTESLVLRDPAGTRQTIEALRALGVQVALDDFGQGHSSLSLLQDLHFDHLKIDRSFIRSLDDGSAKARILMEIMLELARRLETRVTAEGVETPEQLQLLTSLGCDDVQGYLLARPSCAQTAQTLLN